MMDAAHNLPAACPRPLPAPAPPAVLENRHVACLYGLVLERPELDIFARLEPPAWREVRCASAAELSCCRCRTTAAAAV